MPPPQQQWQQGPPQGGAHPPHGAPPLQQWAAPSPAASYAPGPVVVGYTPAVSVPSPVAPSDGGPAAIPVMNPESVGPWTVQLTVVKCSGLPKMDTFGKVDGFVKVRAGAMRSDTKVVKKDFNPVFEHAVPPVELLTYSGGFAIEVYDWDAAGSNDFIGRVMLSTMEILKFGGNRLLVGNSVTFENVWQFQNCKKDISGITLRLTVTWPVMLHPVPIHIKEDFLRRVESNKIFHVLQTWKVSGAKRSRIHFFLTIL